MTAHSRYTPTTPLRRPLPEAGHSPRPATPRGRPEYHMTQLRSFGMTDIRETFVQGATAFRSTRGLAKIHRDGFIEAAKARVRQPDPPSSSGLGGTDGGDDAASRLRPRLRPRQLRVASTWTCPTLRCCWAGLSATVTMYTTWAAPSAAAAGDHIPLV